MPDPGDVSGPGPARASASTETPELPHRTVLPVLGLPVRFATDDPAVLQAVGSTFGDWAGLPQALVTRRPSWVLTEGGEAPGGVSLPFRVSVTVRPGDEGGAWPPALRHRVLAGHRILYSTHGSVALADPGRGDAHAFVTPGLVGAEPWFRTAVLEALTLSLITPFDRQPLHAAGLVRQGTAVLLAGASGAGKSSLAWAGLQEGLAVLSDDTVFLQSRPDLRVWGLPGELHLPAEAARRFPELANREPRALAGGKEKVEVALPAGGGRKAPPVVERAVVCLLEKEGEGPALEPVGPDELVACLTEEPEPGFALFAGSIEAPVRRLVSGGGWRLRRGPDPRRAVHLLERLFDQGAP